MLITLSTLVLIIVFNFLLFLGLEGDSEHNIENILLLVFVFVPVFGTIALMNEKPIWKNKTFRYINSKKENEISEYERNYKAEAERKKRGDYTEKEKTDMLELLKIQNVFDEECMAICKEFKISTKKNNHSLS